jgi:hypothetical protein
MWMRWSVLAVFAWILWIDETVYTMPSSRSDPTPRQLEGAAGRARQISAHSARGQCLAARNTLVREAAAQDDLRDAETRKKNRPLSRYRAQDRYFCAPTADEPAP